MFRFLFSVFLIAKLQPRQESKFSKAIGFSIDVVVAIALALLLSHINNVKSTADTSIVPHDGAICNNFVKNDQFKV
jgi:hypothetical protein